MSTAKTSSSPGVGQTILDWLNPFSSTVPGDPLGGNVAAIPGETVGQAASDVSGVVSTVSNVVSTVSNGVTDTFSVTKFLSQGSSWKAIGLILAGAIMLILAIVEFTVGGSTALITTATVAR